MNKFLIIGLGNKGSEYENTRHNIGWKIIDELAKKHEATWESTNFGWKATVKVKGRMFLLLKPDTYMNLSGKAANYWLQKENIVLENLLVLTDDLNLNFGTIRIKGKGSDGGHNGLKSMQEELNSTQYARLRFGISNEFDKGRQVDYVLGEWSEEENEKLPERLTLCADAIVSFGLQGLAKTMNQFNGK